MIPFTYLSSHLLWTSSRKSVGILAMLHAHVMFIYVYLGGSYPIRNCQWWLFPTKPPPVTCMSKDCLWKSKPTNLNLCSSIVVFLVFDGMYSVHQHNLLIWFEPGKSKLKHDLCFFWSGGGGWWELKNNHSQSCWGSVFCLPNNVGVGNLKFDAENKTQTRQTTGQNSTCSTHFQLAMLPIFLSQPYVISTLSVNWLVVETFVKKFMYPIFGHKIWEPNLKSPKNPDPSQSSRTDGLKIPSPE